MHTETAFRLKVILHYELSFTLNLLFQYAFTLWHIAIQLQEIISHWINMLREPYLDFTCFN